MKSRGILLFCVLAACAEGGVDTGAANGPQSLERASWAVTHAVPAEFATIADALDAADAGDIVEVAPGEYLEDLTMPAGVRLVGDPADPAIVRGTVVVEAVVDVGLGDLVIVGEGRLHRSTGLNILGSDVDVKGVRIEEHGVGVVISGSPDEDGDGAPGGALIAGCDLSNNGVGVIIDGAAGVTVVNNQLLFNDGAAVAISTEFGPNDSVLVLHNTMVANGFGGGVGAAVVATGGGWRASGNLIVSGDIGIHCVDGPCGHDYDLVFGNRVDYSGEAAPGPNDVAADPLFVNPGALDLRLQRRSPAIDAADPDGGVAFDAQGVDRPFGPAPDIGAFEFAPASSRLTLAINEVMSNPLDEAKDEYVELYNFGQNPVDAAGILLTDGDSDDVVQGYDDGPTVVPPAGFALILDPSYEGFYGAFPEGTVLLTVGNATLGNGLSNNDPITLREPEGRRIDTYSFPRNAGNGVSVEKRDVLGGDSEENWAPAPCGNSPGRSSCLLDPPLDPAAIPIVITEVMSNPLTEPSGEFIEIFNTSEDTPFELRNVRLTDGDSTDVLLPYLGGPTAVPPQSFALIIDPDYDNNYPIPDGVVTVTVDGITLGNGLATSDPITLLSPNGDVVLDGFGHPFDAGNGRSIEKVDVPLGDLVVNWIPSPCESGSSPGLPNCAFEFELDLNYAVMITEIMANPLDEDTGEYVEIWNYGNAEVDIATLEIGDGDVIDQIQAFDEGGTTMLQPGQYGLILDSEYNGVYGVPDDVLLLTTDDTTVGSGLQNNDPIFIRGPDGRLLDAYSIPFNAGNGYSVEKADLLVGDVQANWRRSPCRHSAGRLNCAITGQAPRLSRVQLVISEVLANAAVERTGEFVEVFNAGVEDVDLDDLLITDGDATDELEPWMEGATVLSPGEFGLIIDRNYDGDFEIPDDVVVVTVDDATIGSGLTNDDPVEILDAGGQALDSFSFPTDPGDGVSIEKVRLTGGDREGNWLRSCADSGSTPGLKNCSDPNPVGGGNVLGEPCPNGAFDCASSLCLVNLFSGDAFCGQGCDDAEECPELFQCVDVATAAGPLGACVAEAEFREQNGQVGSPCPGGAADCFSDRCLENPRTRLNFCTDRCLEHNECPQSMLCVNIGGFLEFDPVCVPLGLIRDGLTGDPCLNGPVDCVSLLCLTPVEGAPYCTAYCAENACPPDFDCVDVGGEDVCVEGN